ncbi:MAG: polysaccharide biosynthesis/export family protein, partial [Flavisolibacter sp.]|nr:polysaccharide biosynthesis/export family protein [Flavisolibacter sp.]
MKRKHFIKCLLFGIQILIIFLSTSCANTKRVVYFNDLTDTISRFSSPIPENVIQPNDILSISISSPNPEASAIFNQPGQGGGYTVNNEGNIQLPLLGTIHAAGLTTNQLRTNITRTLLERKLLVDPIVNIQNTSFNVTILGEVGGPKVI